MTPQALHPWISGVLVLVALLLVPAVIRAQAMRWPEAVATLAAERTRAETCVRLLKRHAGDDAAALSRGELAYAEATSEEQVSRRRREGTRVSAEHQIDGRAPDLFTDGGSDESIDLRYRHGQEDDPSYRLSC
jgi:hypothetical protein